MDPVGQRQRRMARDSGQEEGLERGAVLAGEIGED
jgi:hypothetical protein